MHISIHCMWKDHLKVVETLLAVDDIQVNQAKNNKATPLHVACQDGQLKVVNMLLAAQGIQDNQANDNESTPLHVAC